MVEIEEVVALNKIVIFWIIIIMNIVGDFGNISLICITLRTPDLRNKSGLLLLITAVSHLICLLSEFVNAFYIITDITVKRRTCAFLIFPYMFFINHQSAMSLVLITDLLLAISRPFWYHACNTANYLLVITTPAMAFGLFFSVMTLYSADDAEIPLCNPPLVLIPFWSRVFSLSNVILNTCVVLLYIISMHLIKKRETSDNLRRAKAVLRRLSVSACVFVFSWYICLVGVDVANYLQLSDLATVYVKSNMVFFAMLCYSQSFYTTYWRSNKYRKAARLLMCWSKKQPFKENSRQATTTLKRPGILKTCNSCK